MAPPRVVIIGAGPAGMAAAAAFAERGALTTMIAPNLRDRWEPRYGAWLDELTELGLERFVAHSWARPRVHAGHKSFVLRSTYAHIDAERLQSHLEARCSAHDVRMIDATVRRIDRTDGGRMARLSTGQEIRADVVIDASGARSPFVKREGEATAAQTAFGLDIEVDAHPWSLDEMVFMDLRGQEGDPPTFLYAQPLSPTRVFVEETSLAAGPPVSLPLLEARLYTRLQEAGIRIRKVHGSERCWIPLDTPVPGPDQTVVPFGAAASFTHPATGYTIVRTLSSAEPLAAAVLEGLKRSPQAAVAAGMESIWPSSLRLSREAHLLGLRVLLGLDAQQQRDWFETFFTLPEDRWRAMLAPGGAPSTVLGSMGAMAMRAPRMVAEAIYNRDTQSFHTAQLTVVPEIQ